MRTRLAATKVVDDLYDAAFEPTRWPTALGNLAKHFDATAAVVIVVDLAVQEATFAAAAGLDWRVLEEYGLSFARLDTWKRFLAEQPTGPQFVCEQLTADDAPELMQLDNGRAGHRGVVHALSAFAARNGSVAVLCDLQRDNASQTFTANEVRRIASILPHLGRSACIHRRLVDVGDIRDALTIALDFVPLAAVLCDRIGRATWLNRCAEDLLHRNDGLRLRLGHLEATAAPKVAARLRQLMAEMSSSSAASAGETRSSDAVYRADGGTAETGMLQIPRRSPQRPLTAIVAPLRRLGFMKGLIRDFARPTVVVLINDPDHVGQVSPNLLVDTLGLTVAEARVAAAVAAGANLATYAKTAQISVGTARGYLKRALSKTNSHRQSELVRTVIAAAGTFGSRRA